MEARIKLDELFLPHFLEIWPYILKTNKRLREQLDDGSIEWAQIPKIEKFILKSARNVGKTEFVVRMQLLLMILDERINWIAILKTKKEGGDKLVGKYKRALRDIGKTLIGIEKEFEFGDTPNYPFVRRYNGKWRQEITFHNYEECEKAGSTPKDPNTYYAGWFGEEFMGAGERNSLNDNNTEMILTNLYTLTGSIKRDLPFDVEGVINFLLMNPYQGSSPILKRFNEYNPDDLDHMKKYGWKSAVSSIELSNGSIESEYYATGAVDVNYYVLTQKKLMEEFEKIKLVDEQLYNTLRFGVNGNPINFPLTQSWNNNVVQRQNEENLYDRKKHFTALGIGIDVSRGVADTAVILLGAFIDNNKKENSFITALDELIFDPKKRKHQPIIWAREILIKLEEWRKYYTFASNEKIYVKVDGANIEFIDSLRKAQMQLTNEDPNILKPLLKFEISSFTPSQKVKWTTDIRMNEWQYGLSERKMLFFQKWTPKLYSQIPLQNYKASGKREDGNDDAINAFEYIAFREMRTMSKWIK